MKREVSMRKMMTIGNVKKTAKVKSKLTGEIHKVSLVARSVLTPKKDVFIIDGKSVVWRDSIRRRYELL